MRLLSKNQQLLLQVLLTNPSRAFYLHELGRIVGKSPGVFQRALNALVEAGIVTDERRAHARFFRANMAHPLSPELTRIIAKTVGVEGALRQLVARLPGIDLALLYGSFAKQTPRADSDIDLLLVGTPRAESRLLKALPPLERRSQREINYKWYSRVEYRRRRAARDPFLEEVLSDRPIVLKGVPNAV